MQKTLITEGSGFVGRAPVKKLLKKNPVVQITSLSRIEQSSINTRNNPICHRCAKPMELSCDSTISGTRQVWQCPRCLVYRIIRCV